MVGQPQQKRLHVCDMALPGIERLVDIESVVILTPVLTG